MSKNPSSIPQAIRLMIGGRVFAQGELNSPASAAEVQQALDAARQKFGHALCLCRRQPLKLQVRLREATYHLAVWPNEGPMHDSECAFFRDELLGTSNDVTQARRPADQNANTPHALVTQPEHRPSRALMGQPKAQAAPISPARQPTTQDAPSTETPQAARRSISLSVPGQRALEDTKHRPLNLQKLAMGLWEEAELCRWHPAWRRDWGRARYQLQQVAKTLLVNDAPLDEFMFVPRPYRESAQEQINAEWAGFTGSLQRRGAGAPGLRMLIAPVRSLSVPPNRPPVMHLRHLRNPIGVSDAAMEFLHIACRAPLRQLQANDNLDRAQRASATKLNVEGYNRNNPEVMGFFLVEGGTRGAVYARAAWLMNVHPRSFIPANSPNTVMLVDALLDRGHAFDRLLADVPPMKKTAPDWLVRHVIGPDGKPVARAALDVLDRGATPEYLQARQAMAKALADKGVPTWYWVPQGSWRERRVPPLPPTDEQPSAEAAQILKDIGEAADCDFQFGHSPRFAT